MKISGVCKVCERMTQARYDRAAGNVLDQFVCTECGRARVYPLVYVTNPLDADVDALLESAKQKPVKAFYAPGNKLAIEFLIYDSVRKFHSEHSEHGENSDGKTGGECATITEGE